MYLRMLGIGHVRTRTIKKIMVAVVWLLFMIASFEYYYYTSSLSNQQSQHVTVSDSQVGNKDMFHMTTQSPQDVEAEKDSKKRTEAVNNVCEKLEKTNVFEVPAAKDRKKVLQRFNVYHHLIVNEKHKLLYCFIPKVGCSNMKRIFLVMDGVYPSIEKVNFHKLNREITRLGNKKFSEEQRNFMLKNFYKFMIVRDPFERLVSAYRNKWQDKHNLELHASLGKRIVEKYRYNHTKQVATGDDVTFPEYVNYLIDTPPEQVNEHWMPYEDLCRPCDVNYDFIGSIDTLIRDVTHVMRQIRANETKYYMRESRRGALTTAKRTTASFLQELPRKHFDQLLAIYKRDHELFGYSVPEYETLDKRYPK